MVMMEIRMVMMEIMMVMIEIMMVMMEIMMVMISGCGRYVGEQLQLHESHPPADEAAHIV